MSDSEDENAFASADEGDDGSGKTAAAKQEAPKPTKEEVTKQKLKSDVGKGQGDSKAKSVGTGASGPDEVKKGKGKQQQQQRNKKKGKGNQAAPKDESGKSDAASSKPSKAGASEKVAKELPPEQKSEPSPVSQTKEKENVTKKSTDGKGDQGATKSKTSSTAAPKSPPAVKPDASKQAKKDIVGEGDAKSQPEAVKESVPTSGVKGTKSPSIVKTPEADKEKQAGDVRRNLQSDVATPEGQDIPREKRDHTPKQEAVLDRLGESAEKPSDGGWGWGSWGSSILTAASSSVQTFTSQVGDGFTTILESVESSLGVPDPEEMAKAKDVTEPTPTKEESPAVTSQPEESKVEQKAAEEKTKGSEAREEDKSKEKESKSQENLDAQKAEKQEDAKKEGDGGGNSWFSSWGVSDIAKKVQSTGKSLASKGQTLVSEGFDAVENLAAGGIDVLETIGKKTYSTLSEHDPAFRKTREYLKSKSDKPNLSDVLKEAKEEAENKAEQARENEEARKAHFGTLFDDYQGIAHLEALEMLSNQSEKKVHSLLNSLSSEDLVKIKPLLISIKEAFEVNEEEDESDETKEQDFSCLVSQHLSELQLGTAPDKLNKVHEMVKQWIVDFDSHESHEGDSTKEVHQKSIQALAELTAKGVEQFHKAGELVLLERDKDKDCRERAHSLARLTGVLCHEIGNLASKFAECLNKMAESKDNSEEITPLVTNVYLEASNSSTYIQDAFQLLLPVLQHAAVEHSIISRDS